MIWHGADVAVEADSDDADADDGDDDDYDDDGNYSLVLFRCCSDSVSCFAR